MLTLPSSNVATSRLPKTYFSGKKPPNFHAKALCSSSLSIKTNNQTNKNSKLRKNPQLPWKSLPACLAALAALLWGFFSSPFLASWCQQEILCLTGNTLLPSPSAGIMGEISSAQGITCPAPRRGDGGEEGATIKVEMRACQPSSRGVACR